MGTSKLIAYLAITGTVAAASFLLPAAAGVTVRLSLAAATVVVFVAALGLRRPKRPVGWWLIAVGGLLTYADAISISATSGLSAGQRLGTVPQLVLGTGALLTLAAGLAVLGWRSPGSSRWDALDTTITAIGAFLLAWVFYIDPRLVRSASSFATAVAVAVPAGSLLIFAMAVKLAFGGALSTWSGRMLLLATAAVLCASGLVVEPIGASMVPIDLPILAAWLAFMILLGAAGMAPGFTVATGDGRPAAARELPFARVGLLVLLALIAPLNVAIGFSRAGATGPSLAAIVVPPLCGTLILLVLVVRLALVARFASDRVQELGERSASLSEAMAKHGELERELAYRAMHDPLTGLGNRDVLTERMDRLRDAYRESRDVMARGQALMMLDLDGFKAVNDSLGHPAGDQVLVDVAQRLDSAVGEKKVVIRLGGDEFVVLLENTSPEVARRAAEAVRQAMQAPYLVSGREVFLSASIGLLVTEPGASPPGAAEGLRDADQALYNAKEAGRNRVTEFHPMPQLREIQHSRMRTGLGHAIARDELILHYQPILGLDDDRIVAVEALVRWRPANSGIIPPSQFLPVAEQTGLIIDLGAWILRQACRDAGPWHAEHNAAVTVNVSGRQLTEPTFTETVLCAMAETGLPGAALVLELAESTLIRNKTEPSVLAQLERLRNNGVRIAIDDFGGDRSSASPIAELPVDLIKFDCPSAHGPAGSPASQPQWAFVRPTLGVISNLKLSAVAVGIETTDQADALRQLNCPYGQGFYFSPPVPAGRIEGLLRRRPVLNRQ